MHPFRRLKQAFESRISPQSFVRLVLLVSGVWLLAIYPALNWFCWDRLPKSMRLEGSDFAQYYSGALVARHGLWPHLYPTLNQDVYNNPPDFKPLISTRFFPADAKMRQGNWFYYPHVAWPKSSQVAPEILALCPRLQGDNHFIYPPPLAVFLWPLGYLDFHTAACGVWFPLMCASFFGMAYFSSRICHLLWGKSTYMEGWVALFPMIPTCLGSSLSTSLTTGNASPILGFLITLFAYSWLRNRQVAMSFGIFPLLIFKGIGLSLCPLLLLRPVKWKTLGVLTILSLLLNVLTLYFGGIELYRFFFAEIVPKSNVALGISLPGLLMTFFGLELTRLFFLLSLLLLGAVYLGYWRRSKTGVHPSTVIAAIVGTISNFCFCNLFAWPHHYHVNYLMLPFSGWILWEGAQAKGAWRKWIFGMFFISLVFWLDGLFLLKDSWLMEMLKGSGRFSEPIGKARSIVNGLIINLLAPLEFIFLLLLAYRRLFFAPPTEAEPAVKDVQSVQK